MVELNAAQKEALESDAQNVVITAPAGSGKTLCLISAVIEYRHKHLDEVIDVITYTRAATTELRDRLAEQHVLDVNISTIHVWARERLKELAVMYGFEVKVLEQEDIMLILRQLIERAHATKMKPEILYSYVTGNKKMDVSDGYAQTLDYLDRMYIAYKRNNGLYDFTDYPLYLLTMLKKYNEKIANTDALFVDELQDVDDEQRQLFELVCARKKFYIGDAWQAIYFFRGADSGIFDSLDDFKRYKLTVNYRSFQEILDYADTFYIQLRERIGQRGLKVSDIDYRLPSGTACERGKGGKVYLTNFWGQTCEIGQAKTNECLPDIFGNTGHNNAPQNTEVDTYKAGCDIMSGNYFILCRTNKQVKGIQDLGFSNVSTVHQAKGLEYDNVLMVDIEAKDNEDLNIAYVAATRARNKLMVMNYNMMYKFLVLYRNNKNELI